MKQIILIVALLAGSLKMTAQSGTDSLANISGNWKLTAINISITEQGSDVLIEKKTVTSRDSMAVVAAAQPYTFRFSYQQVEAEFVAGGGANGVFWVEGNRLLLKKQPIPREPGSDPRMMLADYSWQGLLQQQKLFLVSTFFYKDTRTGKAVAESHEYIYSSEAK